MPYAPLVKKLLLLNTHELGLGRVALRVGLGALTFVNRRLVFLATLFPVVVLLVLVEDFTGHDPK